MFSHNKIQPPPTIVLETHKGQLFYIIIIIIIRMFCPRAGPSLQAQEPNLQFCKRRNHCFSFTTGLNRCSSFPLLSAPILLSSIWTDLKRSEKIPGAPTWWWGEWTWFTGPSRLHWNSPQGLNISSIRVSGQIRVLEILITLCPPIIL